MKIILDTHILLWSLSEPDRIEKEKIDHIKDPSNIIYVSSVSIAEIAIKSSIGKLHIEGDLLEAVQETGFELLPFTAREAVLLKDLPFHHKDPFDRMLICQSMINKHPVLTDDDMFRLYDCALI
jgi:PIN domain nuclease of toxin-antitoxin system